MRKSVAFGAVGQEVHRVRRDLVNESLYGRLCSHFSVNLTSAKESKINHAASVAPLFGEWEDRWNTQIASLLVCQVSEVMYMRAVDLMGAVRPVTYLRFCPSCLGAGYHAAVFQHVAIDRCLVHGERLLEACPRCDQPIVPTLRHARDIQFLCARCEHALSSLHSQRCAKEDAIRLDRAFTVCRRALSRSSAECGSRWPIDEWWRTGVRSVRQRQVYRALCIRDSVDIEQPCQFATKHHIAGPISDSRDWARVGDLEPLLRWLSVSCPEANEACELAHHVHPSAPGLRLNRELGAIAVALIQTLYFFRLQREFCFLHSHPDAHIPSADQDRFAVRSSPRIHGDRALDARVGQLEILGHLAVLLARTRSGAASVDLAWLPRLEPIEYVPVVARSESTASVHVRWRADERTLERLFRRFASSRYVAVSQEELDRRLSRPGGSA